MGRDQFPFQEAKVAQQAAVHAVCAIDSRLWAPELTGLHRQPAGERSSRVDTSDQDGPESRTARVYRAPASHSPRCDMGWRHARNRDRRWTMVDLLASVAITRCRYYGPCSGSRCEPYLIHRFQRVPGTCRPSADPPWPRQPESGRPPAEGSDGVVPGGSSGTSASAVDFDRGQMLDPCSERRCDSFLDWQGKRESSRVRRETSPASRRPRSATSCASPCLEAHSIGNGGDDDPYPRRRPDPPEPAAMQAGRFRAGAATGHNAKRGGCRRRPSGTVTERL